MMLYIIRKNSYPLYYHTLLMLQIFKLHGGQALSTPLLMPKSKYYEKTETCVNLMTHSGFIVTIPHDLRYVIKLKYYLQKKNN